MTSVTQNEQTRTGRMKVHRCGAAAACGCTCASGAGRTGRRSCSFTAGRRTTSAGPSSTRARSPASSGSSPTISAATGCPRRRSSPSTTPTASCGPTTWRRSSRSCISTGRCSSAGPTARSSSATTCAPTARTGSPRSTSSRAWSSWARRPSARSSARAFSTISSEPPPTTCRPTSPPCAPSCGRASSSRCRPTTWRRRCAGTSRCRPRIRANLAAREIDYDDVLRALEVPLLVTQGRADTVVLPAMAEHVLATCPTAEASWYEGTGHVPHLEEPERFNRELAELTRRARA